MRGWPKAFEFDFRLRKAFEGACEEIMGLVTGENWRSGLDKATIDMVLNKAKELLNEYIL